MQPVQTEGALLIQALQLGSVLVQQALLTKSRKLLLLQELQVPTSVDKQSLHRLIGEEQQRVPLKLGHFPDVQAEHLSLALAQSVHDGILFMQQWPLKKSPEEQDVQVFNAVLKQSLQFTSVELQHAFFNEFTNLPAEQALQMVLSIGSQSVQPSIVLQQRGGLAEFKKKPESQPEHIPGMLERHLLQFETLVKSNLSQQAVLSADVA